MNPALLGVKQVCYVCAMQHPNFLLLFSRSDLEKMSTKLDRIEAALKKEGYALPEVRKPEPEAAKKSAPVKRTPTVRIVEPHVVRDDLKNPFWIDLEDHVGDGPKKSLPRLRPTHFPGIRNP